MGANAYIVGGVVVLLIGILLALGGPLFVPYEIPRQMDAYLIVDAKSSPQYDDWAGGLDLKTEYQMVFYFYNLTNSDAVRQKAAVPNFTTLGPYVYRRYRTSINVTFPNNGDQVEFLDFRDYQYDRNASGGRDNLDKITNVNPVFFAALAQAGSEQNMLVAAVGGYLSNFTNYLTGPFISVYTSFSLPSYLPDAINSKIATINATLRNTDNSTDYFLKAWCNETKQTEYGNWTGLLLSYAGVPTNINKWSALALLNASMPFSLLDPSPMSAWTWDRALTDPSHRKTLRTTFLLTDEQIEQIWMWRIAAFGPTFMYNKVISQYDLDEISDLGWVQWTSGNVLGGTIENPVSIGDIFPIQEIGYYCPIELFEAPDGLSFPSWRFSKKVLNPVSGLENVTLFQAFVLAYSQNENGNFSFWGLNTTEADLMFAYSFQLGSAMVAPALINLFGPTGGLILTQTVDDWVFNCNYFLIDLLMPTSPPSCSILVNHSVYSNVTIMSGKNDITEINQYVAWQGSPNVSGVWKGDMPVNGCTELGQFAPNLKEGASLETFNDNFVRTMVLNYTNTSVVSDIPAYQYVLHYNNTFGVNDFFYQTVKGFTNMTATKQAPVFFSLWDMQYVDESIRKKVIGLNDNSTEFETNTVIDVEPITGTTIQSRKRLQVNVFSPTICTWCAPPVLTGSAFGNTNFTPNTFFPYVKAGEYVTISDSLASLLRSKLKEIRYGPQIGFWVGVTAGPVFVLLGVVLVVVGCNRRSSRYYENINDMQPKN